MNLRATAYKLQLRLKEFRACGTVLRQVLEHSWSCGWWLWLQRRPILEPDGTFGGIVKIRMLQIRGILSRREFAASQ